ncbi:MAG: hypothetical protein ACLPSF_04915 [Methylocella sp.]
MTPLNAGGPLRRRARRGRHRPDSLLLSACGFARQPVVDGYGNVIAYRRIRVCN